MERRKIDDQELSLKVSGNSSQSSYPFMVVWDFSISFFPPFSIKPFSIRYEMSVLYQQYSDNKRPGSQFLQIFSKIAVANGIFRTVISELSQYPLPTM